MELKMINEKKIAIISGGSKGLGQALVEALLQRNYFVYTFSRNNSDFVEKAKKDFKDSFVWQSIDSKNFTDIENFVKHIYKEQKRIDLLINNAAIGSDGVLTLMPSKIISDTLAINLESTIRITQACSKYMLLQKQGSILNISSIIGTRGYSGLSVYSATKAGLDGFTRALARELGERNIRVNSIAPGYLETDMSSKLSESQRQQVLRRTPLGRLGKVEDVTELAMFLLSSGASFITGQTFLVDGGISS